MLPLLLGTLAFRSDNVAHQPVTQALASLQAHRNSRQQYVSCDEVPIDGVVRPQMQDILIEETSRGAPRINRINYEICVLQALRDRLRCKEIWVEGARSLPSSGRRSPVRFQRQAQRLLRGAEPTHGCGTVHR